MAKALMKKIEIISLLSDSKSIIERLQQVGVVELLNTKSDELLKVDTKDIINNLKSEVEILKNALEILSKYKKTSILDSLNGRRVISKRYFDENRAFADKTLNVCHSVVNYSRDILNLKSEITRLQTQIDILMPWESLNLPQNFSGTKTVKAFIGAFSGDVAYEDIIEYVSDIPVKIHIISKTKEQTCVLIFCHKAFKERVFSNIKSMGFVSALGTSKLTPKEEMQKLKSKIDEAYSKINNLENSVKDFSCNIEKIEFLIDYFTMQIEKYIALEKTAMTQKTVVINGYIPDEYVKPLSDEFQKKYIAVINIFDTEDEEDVPVLLKNGRFSSPLENITKMYALPNKRDVDPSAIMAFFYYVFFGIMLSDAGYGLIMVIATTFALNKFTIEGSLKKSLEMFKYCGISTVFWGALFGSWFGDLPQVIASNFFGVNIQTTALWFEPIKDPIKMLLFSFLLGIFHLFLGLAVSLKMQWDEGKKLDAIFTVVPVYLTIIGVAPIAAGILTDVPAVFRQIGMYIFIIGVISIILTSNRTGKNIIVRLFGGVYGLYNVATGYLSDILSYSRLLALGLATGSIASVVNLIATMPESIVLKAVLLVVIGLVGHTANLAINLLGAYVHSDRLQFVELFSKFYEGGGREFKPFGINTKYVKFEKENVYE